MNFLYETQYPLHDSDLSNIIALENTPYDGHMINCLAGMLVSTLAQTNSSKKSRKKWQR